MLTTIRQKASFSSKKINEKVCKSLVVIALILFIIYMFFPSHPFSQSSKLSLTSSNKNWIPYDGEHTNSPTSISHIIFGISSSFQSWSNRKNYIDLWWKPNVTRGFLLLDKSPIGLLPWPPISLHVKLYENTSKYKDYDEHGMPYAIQMVLVIAQLFKAHDTKNVRWYVMANDDTVLFTSNLVEVLSRYDHTKYLYIGSNSESIFSNFENSFETAFGGAGIALSYPLAKALAQNVEGCIKRYPTLLGSDHILQSCVADLGVSLTQERGFHQIDLHRDISGLLTAHPQTPLLSLHHLDVIEPIFPSKDRYESIKQLLKAAKVDELRLLQQSICYLKQSNWTFSLSWGYSTHLYEQIIAPSVLQVPIETFSQWMRGVRPPKYMFNTRPPSGNPCDAPHVFFLESVDKNNKDNVFVTSYIRKSPRGLPVCSLSGNHSADHISMIRVLSPMKKFEWVGSRRECCDVIQVPGMNDTTVEIRTCMKDEIIA